jgi:hypothetical protein
MTVKIMLQIGLIVQVVPVQQVLTTTVPLTQHQQVPQPELWSLLMMMVTTTRIVLVLLAQHGQVV